MLSVVQTKVARGATGLFSGISKVYLCYHGKSVRFIIHGGGGLPAEAAVLFPAMSRLNSADFLALNATYQAFAAALGFDYQAFYNLWVGNPAQMQMNSVRSGGGVSTVA